MGNSIIQRVMIGSAKGVINKFTEISCNPAGIGTWHLHTSLNILLEPPTGRKQTTKQHCTFSRIALFSFFDPLVTSDSSFLWMFPSISCCHFSRSWNNCCFSIWFSSSRSWVLRSLFSIFIFSNIWSCSFSLSFLAISFNTSIVETDSTLWTGGGSCRDPEDRIIRYIYLLSYVNAVSLLVAQVINHWKWSGLRTRLYITRMISRIHNGHHKI